MPPDKVGEVLSDLSRQGGYGQKGHAGTSSVFIQFRPLYIQDCLDLLAKPAGALQRFRYQKQWVWVPPDDSGLAKDEYKIEQWEHLKSSTEVIVYFVWSQNLPPGQDTVYVPIRAGRVVRAGVEEGEYFFVEFSLGEYIDPAILKSTEPKKTGTQNQTSWLPRLRELTSSVRRELGRYPQGTYGGKPGGGFSAVLSQLPRDSKATEDKSTSAAFGNAVQALGEIFLLQSDNGHDRADVYMRMLRVRRLRESGNPALISTARFGRASVDLRGGNLYEFDVLVLRTVERPESIGLYVTPPQGCTMVSSDQFVVTSKYDKVTFRLFAEARDSPTVGEMKVCAKDPDEKSAGDESQGQFAGPNQATRPEARDVTRVGKFRLCAKGKDEEQTHSPATTQSNGISRADGFMPEARFQVRVRPRRFLTLSAWMAAILTALATFVVAVIGQQGIYLDANSNSIRAGDKVIDATPVMAWLGMARVNQDLIPVHIR